MITDQLVRQASAAHYAGQTALAASVSSAALDAWAQVDPDDAERSWLRQLASRVRTIVTGGQLLSARRSVEYVRRALALRPTMPAPVAQVVTSRLIDIASDGRPLASLLMRPAVTTTQARREGRSRRESHVLGYTQLDMIVRTQVADAGRVAAGVEVTATPTAGYVRIVNLPACSRCIILAGRWYSHSSGFLRHPRCLPAGTVVSGPATAAATRRWYEGELVVISTTGGQRLSITGNHPVLTTKGWLPANLIKEGDYVIRSTTSQGAVPLVIPDENQVPARIEDLWSASQVVTLGQVPTTTEDFHGDGGYGDVDVVLTDRLLWHRLQTPFSQKVSQERLSGGVRSTALLSQHGSAYQQFVGLSRATNCGVRGSGLSQSLFRGHPARPYLAGGRRTANFDFASVQVATDDVAGNFVMQAESILAFSREVCGNDVISGQNAPSPRWDAPADPLTVQNWLAYASRGMDLFSRLAGQVEPDRVIELRRVGWSGHVYNLTSTEGWYAASGLIVSNCDCTMEPAGRGDAPEAVADPRELFDRMSEQEQRRVFGQAGATAIGDGVGIGRVVNARRGMYAASVGGRQVRATRVQARRRVRLMPEAIYQIAGNNRAEALRLLRVNGYVT